MPQATHSPRPPTDGNDIDNTPSSKRRKVRKGTRSCWECRQRKMKCTFNHSEDTVCIRCLRRGIKCVSQEYPEETTSSLDRNLQMGDRIARIENLLRLDGPQFVHKSDHGAKDIYDEQPVGHNVRVDSSSHNPEASLTAAILKPLDKPESSGFEIIDSNLNTQSSVLEGSRTFFVENSESKYERLSRVLHAFLPSSENTKTIIKACGNTSSLFYQMHIVPYANLDEEKSLETMFTRPDLTAHPIIIAKHMLHIATALQHLHPDFAKDVDGLSEPPREMMRRLATLAVNAVTSNDDLVNCIEGLDCMLVESWYHTNGGNLRKGLVTARRALTIAQLMGLHRPGKAKLKCVDRQTKAYPEFIWFRINSLERYLCLMLGLPQATLDKSMASEANLSCDTPMGRLDRIHCVVTSRILERNQSNLEANNFALTQELDEDLQKASKILPAKWWLTPNLATVADRPEALFWDMRRLFHHLFHYNLLIQLHLPWMLYYSTSGQDNQHSQSICINSAREILSRFVMFHSFNRIAFSCRTVDFFGLMATTTLLAAHVDGHSRLSSFVGSQQPSNYAINPLVHQRLGDRALVESMQEIMNEVSRLENDTMSMQLSNILQRLMAIEAEAEDGRYPLENGDTVQLSIPYFGSIEITNRGLVSRDATKMQVMPETAKGHECPSDTGPINASRQTMCNDDPIQPSISTSSDDAGVLSNTDMALFDSLMGGTGDEESGGIDWLAWLHDFQMPGDYDKA